jgi:23S rRNA (adenine-N6)-dimethyltransferase
VPGGRPAERRLGQHFLRSPALARRLVDDAGVGSDEVVVEIGAGHGVLTAALAARAATVIAIEVDHRCVARLRAAAPPNVVVLEADAVTLPLPRTPFRVVANPPFAATSALLHRLLDDAGSGLVRADLVVQWQVARARARAAAGPCDLAAATWGPWWTFRRGRRLPASVFRPAPSVDGAMLVVERRSPPLLPDADRSAYRDLVRREHATGRPRAADVDGWVRRFRAR